MAWLGGSALLAANSAYVFTNRLPVGSAGRGPAPPLSLFA